VGGANTGYSEPHRSGDTHTHTDVHLVCHISRAVVTQIHTYTGWVLPPMGGRGGQADPQ
jgi:hypothetical protein